MTLGIYRLCRIFLGRFYKSHPLHFLHCLTEVGNDIVCILYANRKTHKVWSDTSLTKLLVRQLTMGVTGWMEHTRAGIGNMCHNRDKLQIVHEADCFLSRTLQSEGNHSTSAVRHVLLSKRMVAVVLQSGIVHPANLVVALKPFCHLLGIAAMLAHTKGESLKTEV